MGDIVYLQTALYRTIKEWRKQDVSRRENYVFWDTLKETKFSYVFLKILGSNLFCKRLHVLDVGSGKSSTSRTIAGDHEVGKYHSIDWGMEESRFEGKSNDIKHYRMDVYGHDVTKDMPLNTFDVIIIDIEPHGQEIFIYTKLRPAMKATHMCVLKHIGSLDSGSHMADRFLGHFIDTRNVHDYFAETSLNRGYRDVFVVMSKDPVRLDGKCQRLAVGEPSRWVDPDLRGFVLNNGTRDRDYNRNTL